MVHSGNAFTLTRLGEVQSVSIHFLATDPDNDILKVHLRAGHKTDCS